jgi:hypothetical protein
MFSKLRRSKRAEGLLSSTRVFVTEADQKGKGLLDINIPKCTSTLEPHHMN